MSQLIERFIIISCLICSGSVFAAKCVVTGCSGEICAKEEENVLSTCLWKAEYECYHNYGICEENDKGQCEWRQTSELKACVKLREEEVEKADLFSD